jgi:hypothetical protein
MDRKTIEAEIKKINPNKIYYYNNSIVEWFDDSPTLSNELLSILTDDEISDLYFKLKKGF